MKKKGEAERAAESEHELHMWTPFDLEIDESYKYIPHGKTYGIGYKAVKIFAYFVFGILNPILFGFKISGTENLKNIGNSGAVTICNHIHPLDCTMVAMTAGLRRHYFVNLQSNLEIPVIRHLVRILGGVPTPRHVKFLGNFEKEVCGELKNGALVQIYPEGVLKKYYNGMRTFKNGAFSLAFSAGVPLVPLVITQHKRSGLSSIFRKNPCLHINVLPAVYPDTSAEKRKEIQRLKAECYGNMKDFYNSYSDIGKLPELVECEPVLSEQQA